MRVKAVLFDVDGVLIDSMSLHFAAWDAAFSVVNFHPSRNDYHNLGGMPAVQTVCWFNETYKLGLSAEQMTEVVKRKHVEAKVHLNTINIYDGVSEIFTLLQKHNIVICAVTGMPKTTAVKILSEYFPNTFAHITGFGDYELGKPHPGPFLLGWEKTGLQKGECIVVEDSPLGIKSATAAGIQSIGITTSVDYESLQKENATYVVNSHSELKTVFANLLEN